MVFEDHTLTGLVKLMMAAVAEEDQYNYKRKISYVNEWNFPFYFFFLEKIVFHQITQIST